MIQGLQIDISAVELKSHLEGRVAHHREKIAWYATQVAALKAGGEGNPGATNDPVSSLERSRQSHVERAALFAFMADHIIQDETYRLSESDLGRIELMARYGF